MFVTESQFEVRQILEKMYVYIYIYICVCVCVCVCVCMYIGESCRNHTGFQIVPPLISQDWPCTGVMC
jgi:hypothetical protein